MPAGNTFLIYSYFRAAHIIIFRCEFLYRHAKNLQSVISFFLFLSFNCSYKGSSENKMCSCYSVSLQEETYVLLHYLSRLNNSLFYKSEKGKPITLAEKKQFCCAPSSESNTDLCRSCRSTPTTRWKKHFSSFGTDPLRQSGEKQAQRESKYYDRFISEEKIFTNMIRNGSMLRDAILYFIKLSKEL